MAPGCIDSLSCPENRCWCSIKISEELNNEGRRGITKMISVWGAETELDHCYECSSLGGDINAVHETQRRRGRLLPPRLLVLAKDSMRVTSSSRGRRVSGKLSRGWTVPKHGFAPPKKAEKSFSLSKNSAFKSSQCLITQDWMNDMMILEMDSCISLPNLSIVWSTVTRSHVRRRRS